MEGQAVPCAAAETAMKRSAFTEHNLSAVVPAKAGTHNHQGFKPRKMVPHRDDTA